jgi:hypothetical protein
VVKIEWDAAAVSLFKQDLYTDGSEPFIRIYHTTNHAAGVAFRPPCEELISAMDYLLKASSDSECQVFYEANAVRF